MQSIINICTRNARKIFTQTTKEAGNIPKWEIMKLNTSNGTTKLTSTSPTTCPRLAPCNKDSFVRRTQQVIENYQPIVFKKSKTVEEAIEYAQKKLGIDSISGFENSDLIVLNKLLKQYTQVQNTLKGTAKFPQKLEYSKECARAHLTTETNTIVIPHIDTSIDSILKSLEFSGMIKVSDKIGANGYQVLNHTEMKKLASLIRAYESGTIGNAGKYYLYETLAHLSERTNILFDPTVFVQKYLPAIKKVDKSFTIEDFLALRPYYKDVELRRLMKSIDLDTGFIVGDKKATSYLERTILHELGHAQNKAAQRHSTYHFKSPDEYPQYLREWTASTQNLDTAGKVSEYSKTGPSEFIAETFADIIMGKKYSDDILNLYKQWGGPHIPGVV